jgi:hypothetical protein
MYLAVITFYASLVGISMMLGRKVVTMHRGASRHPHPFSHALFVFGFERVLVPIRKRSVKFVKVVHQAKKRFVKAVAHERSQFVRDIPDSPSQSVPKQDRDDSVVSFHLKRIAQQKQMMPTHKKSHS